MACLRMFDGAHDDQQCVWGAEATGHRWNPQTTNFPGALIFGLWLISNSFRQVFQHLNANASWSHVESAWDQTYIQTLPDLQTYFEIFSSELSS